MAGQRTIRVALFLAIALAAMPAWAQTPTSKPATMPATTSAPAIDLSQMLPNVKTPGDTGSAVNWIVVATVLAVAPAVLVLVTCFTRVIVVLGLLRAALATQQMPPNQVLFGLALLMTVVVMAPTYNLVHRDAIAPYSAGQLTAQQAFAAGETHVREYMIRQIESAGNNEDGLLFLDARQKETAKTWADVPTRCLIPGYVVSELKVAFMMGFKIFLPFLIVDMLVAGVLVSMGMLMVPPVLISLPLKLLLFVLADGWHLVVGTLMSSFW